MDEIKRISYEQFLETVSDKGFDFDLTLKDYYITAILYLLRDVKGIYFKGGTALQKIFLGHARISEDIDFTLTKDLSIVKKEIKSILEKISLFSNITQDKDVEGFTRLVVHYKGFFGKEDAVFIDLNQRGKLETNPEMHEINHFYKDNIPRFSLNTISREEMAAEKVAAAIGRNKPRDHYDLYQIIKYGIPLNMELVKKKCKSSGNEFSIIKMFNQSQKLHKRWHEDMAPLLVKEITFEEVMEFLVNHFKLKEEKEKQKDKKK
jgi:predicted nucleotidyltransferase component of viral defense system